MSLLTDSISKRINDLQTEILASQLWDDEELRAKVLKDFIPPSMQEAVGLDAILQRVPPAYLQHMFAAALAASFCYSHGLGQSDIAFYSFIRAAHAH